MKMQRQGLMQEIFYNEQVLSSEKILQETQLALMADGYNKELALLDMKYQNIRLKHQQFQALLNIDREIEKESLQKRQLKQGLSDVASNLQLMSGKWKGFMKVYQVWSSGLCASLLPMPLINQWQASPFGGRCLRARPIAGLAQVARIKSIKFATGTKDFITNGPMMMMVGDNRGGRERVTVQPLSSPNVNGPPVGTQAVFNFYDQSGSLVDSMRREIRSGIADDLIQDLFNRYGYLK